MSNRKYYCFCADNCKFETMTKEQIINAIYEAVTTGEIKDIDTGFITTVKEQNKGNSLVFWLGTTAEYNAIETKDPNCCYIKTDDTALADLSAIITTIQKKVDSLDTSVNNFEKHANAKNNPHNVTAEQVGAVSSSDIQTGSNDNGSYMKIGKILIQWGAIVVSELTKETPKEFYLTFPVSYEGSNYSVTFTPVTTQPSLFYASIYRRGYIGCNCYIQTNGNATSDTLLWIAIGKIA